MILTLTIHSFVKNELHNNNKKQTKQINSSILNNSI